MKKISKIYFHIGILKPLAIMLAFILIPLLSAYAEESENTGEKRSVLMVIAMENFRDEELFVPAKLFEERDIKVTIASTVTSKVTGMLNGIAKPNILLENVKAKDYDAVIFVGGIGAQMYYNDKIAHQIAEDAVKQDKVLAAICIAPNILAKAGLLQGRKATCWDSAILTENGAKYQRNSVVRDGKIITANGPQAAYEFGQTIIKAMTE